MISTSTKRSKLLSSYLTVGNFPAFERPMITVRVCLGDKRLLRQTWTEETRNLLNQGIAGHESIVFCTRRCELIILSLCKSLPTPSKLLDELFVLVQLLQVVTAHGIDPMIWKKVRTKDHNMFKDI